MVAVAMRTRFDLFDKELVRAALESHCSVETDAEVAVDTRRIDLWFTPTLRSKPAMIRSF